MPEFHSLWPDGDLIAIKNTFAKDTEDTTNERGRTGVKTDPSRATSSSSMGTKTASWQVSEKILWLQIQTTHIRSNLQKSNLE